MTISYIGAGTYTGGTGNLTPTLHASTAAGDLLLAHVGKRASGETLTPDGSWTELHRHSTSPAGNISEFSIWGKIAGASESSPTFTASGSTSGLAHVATFRSTVGFTIGSIVNQATEVAQDFDTNITAAAITPTVDNCLVVFCGKRRDTVATATASALSGTTEIGQEVFGTTLSLLAVWNYVIQTTAGALTPGDWTISDSAGNNTAGSISLALVESAAADLVPDVEPLYLGYTLLANKTGVKFTVRVGHDNLDGNVISSGTTATIDASGLLVLPPVGTNDGEPMSATDPVTLSVYWTEGSDPEVDRSLIVQTTLVEA